MTIDPLLKISESTSEQNIGFTPSAEFESEDHHDELLQQLGNTKIYGIGTGYHDNLDQVIRAIKFLLSDLEAAKVRRASLLEKFTTSLGTTAMFVALSTLRHYICYEKKKWILFESWHAFPKGAEYIISRLILVKFGENGALVVETWTRQQLVKYDWKVRNARAENELAAAANLTTAVGAILQDGGEGEVESGGGAPESRRARRRRREAEKRAAQQI